MCNNSRGLPTQISIQNKATIKQGERVFQHFIATTPNDPHHLKHIKRNGLLTSFPQKSYQELYNYYCDEHGNHASIGNMNISTVADPCRSTTLETLAKKKQNKTNNNKRRADLQELPQSWLQIHCTGHCAARESHEYIINSEAKDAGTVLV